ncbi:Ribokinase-like protein [Schizothecium vesticola]|uniref:Ribokinase n=1 Tax=Schizothecium vesticola TaxID=314040 RepID=A0AA40EWP2_9PEZI|nr:Ribokinase-like protein [Schizothecium vesticola]
MPPLPTLTILGSLNIDLVSRVPHHPAPGETLTATAFSLSPGGKGANQAVACAKLSRPSSSSSSPSDATATVRMLGAVGSDSYGALLTSNLAAHGVDVSGVRVRQDAKTGVAIIIVDEPTGENRIILSPEANHAVRAGDVAGMLGEGETDLLIMQLEIPLETVVAALGAARARGVPVLLNPAPAQRLPAGALRGVAHLVVNETEAAMLGGVEVGALDGVEGLEAVARGLVEGEGVGNVVITLGGRGVFYREGGEGKGRSGLVPAERARVVDTTAAGDTFVGAYALEVVGGRFDIEEAVRKANRAAARTVERRGAQDSIPWRDELE